jgi:hypothetical protein
MAGNKEVARAAADDASEKKRPLDSEAECLP